MFDFNPLSPEFQSNPYAYYGMLRQYAPVFHFEAWGTWFLSRYEDCVTVLKSQSVGHSAEKLLPPEELERRRAAIPPSQFPLWEVQRSWMLFNDPPTHTRLRGLVHKAFTPRMIERLKDKAQQLTDNLLDEAQRKGKLELIEDLAFPLPVTVIAELIGIPVSDQEVFRGWSRALAGTLEMTEAEAVYTRGSVAAAEFSDYLRKLIATRRNDPQDDLLSALIAAEEAGDKLTEAEMISNVILLLVAGHETTVNLIGNGTYALLTHPAQVARLSADPTLARSAVEECLRFDSPVQMTSRLVQEPIEVNGQTINAGYQVAALLGAANRDPEQFANPDDFDITRPNASQHIGFGNGIHFCLGAPLARLEGEIALRTLFTRFPKLALDPNEPPQHRQTFVLRGYERMMLQF